MSGNTETTLADQLRDFAIGKKAVFSSRMAFDAMDDIEDIQKIHLAVNQLFKQRELGRTKNDSGKGFLYIWHEYASKEFEFADQPATAAKAKPKVAQKKPITPRQIDGEHLAETFHPLPASPVSVAADTFLRAQTKPTNPKDAIGSKKAPMSTVPASVIAELGVAMLEGAAKYGRHNYRAMGVRASVYYDATMRHLFAWWEGEDLDPDSGVSHVTKAIASLVVLRDCMMSGKLTDDRAPSIEAFYPRLNSAAAEVMDKHADKSPRHYTIEDAL